MSYLQRVHSFSTIKGVLNHKRSNSKERIYYHLQLDILKLCVVKVRMYAKSCSIISEIVSAQLRQRCV